MQQVQTKKTLTYSAMGLLLALCLGGLLSGCASSSSANEQAPAAATNAVAIPKETKPAQVVSHALTATQLQQLQQGIQAYQDRQYPKAIAIFDRLLEETPTSWQALSEKGMALALSGHVQEGLALTKKAEAIAPGQLTVAYNLALIYKLDHQYGPAKHWFLQVLAKEPTHTWSLYGMATIYADEGQQQEALAYLTQAIATNPSVKAIAREQNHWASYHGQPTFEALTAPKK